MPFQFQQAFVAAFIFTSVSFSALAQPAMPPFYEAVTKLKAEGKLGQVIKKESIKTNIPGAQAWRIAYISSDVSNRKTISTGLIVAPIGKASSEGRPVMAWAHGTTGTAQSCGPSQVFNPAVDLNEYFLVGGNSWTDYGLPNLETFIKEGYVVVATDYQGLGGGGKHQYTVAATQSQDLINSVRAAHSMIEVSASKKAIAYGWSQGGGAVIAAASQKEYITQTGTAADGIEFLGFVALAPYDTGISLAGKKLDVDSANQLFTGLNDVFTNNIFNFTHFSMNLWGTQAAFPSLSLSDFFTDEGVKVLNDVYSNKCVHAASDTLNFVFGEKYKSLMKLQPSNTLAWAQAMVKGSVLPAKPVAPVAIYWGTADTVVPPPMGQAYRQQMCGLGGNVARFQLPGQQTHFTTPPVAAPHYLPWIKDRIAGKVPENGCLSEIVLK
ncbi:alpha/beta fold hydrolase [Polynucleobacter brandtiae]|uniref:Secretory lipase n=1 Tax=Polynucleobacter brandtiae TaxID=1938816 RepID=A0A2M8VQR6_9BURK|nr:alpha/beta fold hydrolase [Polynucleobacter brandtiae]PJI79511.1 secretory lipase [Polynucleobacter brandtiae]